MAPKTKQIQPELPWHEAPVPLPDDFPVSCSDVYIQTDRPITYLHRHDVPEIGYCHRGSGIWVVGSKIMTFGERDIIVITEEETHLAQSTPGTTSEWTWVYCDPLRLFGPGDPQRPAPDLSRLRGPGFHNLFPAAAHPQLNALVSGIIAECRSAPAHHRQVVSGMLYALFSLLQRHGPACQPDQPPAAAGKRTDLGRTARAVEHIILHYTDRIDIDHLASLCHMSVTNFRRVFTRALGKTPQEYVNAVRLSMAELELRSTDRKVSDIALRAGFPTLSAFNRLFKLRNGVTPRGWRRAGWRGYGALAGTVLEEKDIVSPTGEIWEAER